MAHQQKSQKSNQDKPPPPRVTARSSSVAPCRPVVHARVHVALVGFGVSWLPHVSSVSTGHARPSRALHHGAPALVGPRPHHASSKTLTDREKI